jgi:extradiol dioxygenase family protein
MADVVSRINSVDHTTVPSIDLVADFNFYRKFMGGDFQKKGPSMVNLSIARQKQGRAPIFFLEISGMGGFGLFLQSEYPPEPLRMLEGPRYGFAVVGKDLNLASSILREHKIKFLGPISHESQSPFQESLYLKDASGNSIELAVWRDRDNVSPVGAQGLIPLAGLCHVAVDTVGLDRGEDFYANALGMELLYRGKHFEGGDKCVLRVGSGQIVTLQEVKAMSERSVKRYKSDPHFALTTSSVSWDFIRNELQARGVTLLPDYIAADGTRPADEKNVYVKDPSGNNVQIFTRNLE